MFRSYQVDVVDSTNFLQLDIPLGQLFWRNVETVFLVSNIMILAKHTAQVASAEKHTAAAIVTLQAWFFAEMRRDCVNDYICADQTCAGLLESVDATEPRTEIAVAQVLVCR